VQLTKGITAQRLNGSTVQEITAHRSHLTAHRFTLNSQHDIDKMGFLYIYLLLFIYYIIVTIFFGQYQERYRLPVMVVFIVPMLGYFIATFDRKQFMNRTSLGIKGALIALFMTIWVFQAKTAIGNKVRLENAIEKIEGELR
jgi:hypothetical protein